MDDFDREIRMAFHGRPLPGAPDSLIETLASLPARPGRTARWPLRPALAIGAAFIGVAVAIVVLSGKLATVPPAGTPGSSLPAVVGPSTAPSASASAGPSVAPSVAPTASAAPTPVASASAPSEPAPAVNVGPAGLIDAEHGWAVGDQRLLLTEDGGSTWRDATPPAATEGSSPANLLQVDFLDAIHGWVAFAEPFKVATDPGFGRVDVWRTSDSGRTWAKTELPPAKVNNQGDTPGPLAFDFLDADHGFALISGSYAHTLGDGDLYSTADGGRTWSADRPTGSGSSGVEGSAIAFSTTIDGVVVGSPVGTGVSVTLDGGKTWRSAALAAPAGMSGALRFFGQPVFFDARSGLVPVQFEGDSGNVTRVYRTTDGGVTWSFLARVPLDGAPSVSILDPQHWIAANGAAVVSTSSGGVPWTTVASQPALTSMQTAQFVAAGTGWAVWTDFLGTSHLLATSDGGATWRALMP